MFKNVLIGFVSAMSAFLTYVAMQPAAYTVTRSVLVAAPPAAVFPYIDDFRKWNAWSPWAGKDANARTAISGPPSGVGATFAWSGNKEIGEGQMTIVESQPAERIAIRLDLVRPHSGTSGAVFTLQPEGAGTRVTWTLNGENGFFDRAALMMVGIKLDQTVGADYEKGLANLKAVAEAGAKG
ncbi:MAG: SRPBCC family protein [Hyphomicrobiaceae bacterium]